MKRFISFVFLAAACLLAVPHSSQGRPFQELLPPDSVFFFSIPDIAPAKGYLEACGILALMEDPEMKPLVEQVGGILGQMLAGFAEETGIDPKEIPGWATGRIGLAVTDLDLSGDAPRIGGVLLLDAGDNLPKIRGLFEKAIKDIDSSDVHLNREEVRGAEVYTLSPVEPELRKFMSKIQLAFAEKTAILAFNTECLSGLLAAEEGETISALSENEAYRTAFGRLKGSAPVLEMFINLPAIIRQLANVGPDAPKYIRALGGESFGAIAGAYSIGGDGMLTQDAFLSIPGEPRGIAGILLQKNVNLGPPAYVPAGTDLLFGFSLDIPKMLDIIERIILDFDPDVHKDFEEGMASMEDMNGDPVDFKRDFINTLGDRLYLLETVESMDVDDEGGMMNWGMMMLPMMGLGAENMVFAVRLSDSQRFAATFGRMEMGMMFQPRDFQGVIINEMNFGWGEPEYGYFIHNDLLAYGKIPALESILRNSGGEGNSLADSKVFREVSTDFPSETTMLVYQSPKYTAMNLYQQVAVLSLYGMMHGLDIDDYDMMMDPSESMKNMPKPEFFLKYMGTAAGYVTNTGDGLYMRSVYSPPKIKK